jgi:hypothetical protein
MKKRKGRKKKPNSPNKVEEKIRTTEKIIIIPI